MSEPRTSTRTDSGPRKRARVWWRVIGTIVAIVGLGWSLLTVVSLLARHSVEIDRMVDATSVDTLELRIRSGNLEIVGSDTTSISLTATRTGGIVSGDHSESLEGRTYVVRSSCPLIGIGSCSANYRLEVPKSIHVRVVSQETSVNLRDLDGRVDVRTSNSPIRVTGLGGETDLRTSNDLIDAVGLKGQSTKLVTSNDRVTAEFASPPRRVDIRTSNDSVTLLIPDTPATFDTSVATSNGDRTVSIRTDPDSDRRITVKTSNDDVRVAYTPD